MDGITQTFDKRIDMLDWMDPPTKSKAHQKVELLKHMVGYPEIIEHPAQLDDKYREVRLAYD